MYLRLDRVMGFFEVIRLGDIDLKGAGWEAVRL